MTDSFNRLGFLFIFLVTCLPASAATLPEPLKEAKIYTQVGAGIFNQLAFRTLFRLSNESLEQASARFLFFSTDSQPMELELDSRFSGMLDPSGDLDFNEEGNIVEVVLPPNSAIEIWSVPSEEPALGWARLEISGEIETQSFVQFANRNGDFEQSLIREAENHPTSGLSHFSFPVSRNQSGINTGLGLLNLSAGEATVSLLLRPDQAFQLTLAPNEMISGFLPTILAASGTPPTSLNVPLTVMEVRSEAPLGSVVFRTVDGLAMSGVKVTPVVAVPGEVAEASLGEEVQLSLGESTLIASEQLQVTFANLPEDSRCPDDVTCVWEGQAVAILELSSGDEDPVQVELIQRAGHPDLSTGTVGEYRLELLEVTPHPSAGTQIPVTEYEITLRVSRTEP